MSPDTNPTPARRPRAKASDDGQHEAILDATLQANGIDRWRVTHANANELMAIDSIVDCYLEDPDRLHLPFTGEPLRQAKLRILLCLLETKSVILDRLAHACLLPLSGEQAASSNATAPPHDLDGRPARTSSAGQTQTNLRDLAAPSKDPPFHQWLRNELIRQEHDLHRVRLLERRWDIWRRVLVREPVAVIMGSLMLATLTMTLVVATLIRASVPQILANTFLVLLGYFFGHTVLVHRSR